MKRRLYDLQTFVTTITRRLYVAMTGRHEWRTMPGLFTIERVVRRRALNDHN